MSVKITLEELIAEADRASSETKKQEGYTRAELSAIWNKSTVKTLDAVKSLIAAGKAKTSRGYRISVDGMNRMVPIYIFKGVQAK